MCTGGRKAGKVHEHEARGRWNIREKWKKFISISIKEGTKVRGKKSEKKYGWSLESTDEEPWTWSPRIWRVYRTSLCIPTHYISACFRRKNAIGLLKGDLIPSVSTFWSSALGARV